MKQPDPQETALEKLFDPIVRERGLAIVSVELKGGRGSRVLRVTLERPEAGSGPGSGVGIGDCAAVSREISALLDVEDPIDGPFHLEVSSPGVERPLRKRVDFERFAGEQVAVRHRTEEGRRTVRGLLKGIDATDQILLETKQGVERVALDAVEKAHLVYDFGKSARR